MVSVIDKQLNEHKKALGIVAIIFVFFFLCITGNLRQYDIDCCGFVDTGCIGCAEPETVTIVEECGSCVESVFPNCAGECEGSTEQVPISCLPTANIAGGYTCQCQEVWNTA